MSFYKQRGMRHTLLYGLLFLTFGCGGTSSDSEILIEGTLTEGGVISHHSKSDISMRHSSGERIEEVLICALGRCSLTDAQGQWGFVIDQEFQGGDILLTAEGHGITSQTTISVPASAREVVVDLEHREGALVVNHLTLDGETQHLEETHHED
jgi:hypothetical protein